MRFQKAKLVGALLVAVQGVAWAEGPLKPTPADLKGPWNAPDAAVILDPFHENNYEIADLKLDPKIAGIIHKATEGGAIEDHAYEDRKKAAIAAGYLWGSYHLGRPGNAVQQAIRYLDKVKPGPSEVIALDLEQGGGEMSMAEAAQFVAEVRRRTGRYPLLYGSRATVSRPVTEDEKEILRHCPLWIVSTMDAPKGWPTAIWPKYALWQFSSELRYRYPIAKAPTSAKPVSWDIDVNYFAGSPSELVREWPFTEN
jgi:GH25 family lysozyme M1 (1,4-beta-N-acetylmuramidase)